MEKPLLIFNRKFDIRIWALINNLSKKMQFYVFREGYLRLSSLEYNIENKNDIKNKFIHLTNNAIQKYSEDYGKFESGN